MNFWRMALDTGEVYIAVFASAALLILLVAGTAAFCSIFLKPRPPLDAIATAVTCTMCSRLPRGSCSCSAHCGHKRCRGQWHKALPKRTPTWTADDLDVVDGRKGLPL